MSPPQTFVTMGNTATHPQNSSSERKSRKSEPREMPKTLRGPINGYYYHVKDEQKVRENNEQNKESFDGIPILFKYTGIDLEQYQKEKNQNKLTQQTEIEGQQDNKDHDDDNDNVDLQSMKEFQSIKFEWVYLIANDPLAKKIKEKSDGIASEYEALRQALFQNDPIPASFMNKQKIAGKVMNTMMDTRLAKNTDLKCKIIIKEIRTKTPGAVYHPALLVWDPKKQEDISFKDDCAFMIHLIKSDPDPEEIQGKGKDNIDEEMEIECRMVTRQQLDDNGYEYERYAVQDLKLSTGLTDIGHWCLKYEMINDYKYETYKTDCVQFMRKMCDEFGIDYGDDKYWSNNLTYAFGKATHNVLDSLPKTCFGKK